MKLLSIQTATQVSEFLDNFLTSSLHKALYFQIITIFSGMLNTGVRGGGDGSDVVGGGDNSGDGCGGGEAITAVEDDDDVEDDL